MGKVNGRVVFPYTKELHD